MIRLRLFVSCASFFLIVFSDSTVLIGQHLNHLFVYFENNDQSDKKETYGAFYLEDEKMKRRQVSTKQEHLLHLVDSILTTLPREQRNILFFVHGLWADNPKFVEQYGGQLQHHIFDKTSTKYGITISLQWEGLWDYRKSFPITQDVGNRYARLIADITEKGRAQNADLQIGFFVHSMGHRVLYQTFAEWQKEEETVPVAALVFCAADLETEKFEDSIMGPIVRATERTSVFYNPNDQTLSMASQLVKGQRLGVTGPVPSGEDFWPNVAVYNAGDFNDYETFSGRFSQHRYYYDSARARALIVHSLLGTEAGSD